MDTDNGATDPYGDDCAAYANFPDWCGNYDDDDFQSNDMCCACGGGDSSGGDAGGGDDTGDAGDTGDTGDGEDPQRAPIPITVRQIPTGMIVLHTQTSRTGVATTTMMISNPMTCAVHAAVET